MNEGDSDGRRGRSRRSFLAAASGGLASSAAVSGCLRLEESDGTTVPGDGGEPGAEAPTAGDGDDDGDGPPSNTGTPTDTPMTTTATTAEPTTATSTATTTAEPSTTTTADDSSTTTTEDDSSTTTTADDSSTGSDGRRLQLVSTTLSTLDPIKATDAASESVIEQLYETLVTHPNGEARIEGQLASDVAVSADYRTYTFTLKDGVRFHDGSELTADDVVYSFERLAASDNSRRQYFMLDYALHVEHETDDSGEYVPGSLGIEAVDDDTFKMRLAQPFAPALDMIAYSAFSVVPREIVGDIDVMPAGGLDDDETTPVNGSLSHGEFASRRPIGTGPFQFSRWETSQHVDVEYFPDHHEGRPSIDGVHWRVITQPETAYQYSLNHNSDVVSIPENEYDPGKVSVEGTDDLGRQYGTYGPLANGDTVNYLRVATLNTFYVGMNCGNVPKPVRQAVAYATNQHDVVDQVFDGRYRPAYHLTPPAVFPGGPPRYTAHAESNYPYGYAESNLDAAARVMEDAGYGENNTYELTMTTYTSPSWQNIMKKIRDALSFAHVDVQLEEAPFSTLLERGRNGDLEAYSLGWITDWPAPDNILGQAVPALTDTDQSGGASGFYLDWDDGTPAVVERASDAWDVVQSNPEPTASAKEARNEAYLAMEEALWDDAALLPLYHQSEERFWYDWADVPRFGGLGPSRQTYDDVTIEARDR